MGNLGSAFFTQWLINFLYGLCGGRATGPASVGTRQIHHHIRSMAAEVVGQRELGVQVHCAKANFSPQFRHGAMQHLAKLVQRRGQDTGFEDAQIILIPNTRTP
jgi:hypothetical protein